MKIKIKIKVKNEAEAEKEAAGNPKNATFIRKCPSRACGRGVKM